MTLATLDWAVLLAYFVVITAIGLIAGARVRRTPEYFLGGRRFGPWLMVGQSFGVGTHAEMPVALAGAVYTSGASAIWFQWKNLFITPFYWIIAPVFRRIRRTTAGGVGEHHALEDARVLERECLADHPAHGQPRPVRLPDLEGVEQPLHLVGQLQLGAQLLEDLRAAVLDEAVQPLLELADLREQIAHP